MSKQKFSPESTRQRRASSRRSALRVLVVENHADTREGILVFLKALGYQATPAGSAREALAQAQHETFDLLLSDITLPDADGWTLLTTLRERGQEPRNAVAMSGLNGPAEQARSREVGYKAHLVKPFAPQSLEKLLRQVMSNVAAAPSVSHPASTRQQQLKQRLHDGLCQQLVASSLLQAALVNRLEAMERSAAHGGDARLAPPPPGVGDASWLPVVGEARRIGDLICQTLEEARALMQMLEE